MALSKLSGDEQGIILGQLCNTFEPRLAVYFSSACTELRVLLTPAVRQQLRADYEAAAALCIKMGMRSCKELREATFFRWDDAGLSEADLATLASLGSELPALSKRIKIRWQAAWWLALVLAPCHDEMCLVRVPSRSVLWSSG